FHDGTPVLASDCVTSITRFCVRNAFGQALAMRIDGITAPSDKVIQFRLKQPFALLPNALAEVYCVMMPQRLAKTDAFTQISEAVGSGPFKYLASERIVGQRVVFEKFDKYVPRPGGVPSFNAGPKIVYVDRVVWNVIPDPATALAALTQGETDWWEQPTIDLIPLLQRSKGITVAVKDRTGEMGCLRFNQLFPPFDNAAIRRVVVAAMDQKEVMDAVAGSDLSLVRTDIGLFVPGTPMASTVGVKITRGPKNYARLKQDLIAAGYKGEKVVILAASNFPAIWAEAQVATDTLKKIGMNVDFQALDWSAVVQRRASKQPIDKGGWNIFFTYLGGFGNISPAPNIVITSGNGAWFGWPNDPAMDKLRAGWFDAPNLAAQKKIAEQMQVEFWKNPSYAPLGMYDQPTAFHDYLTGIPAGWPQFYGVKKNA
ncbi:MAG TPA: ABC transporter substrate-binding protein, partial [Acetobacteraceae bacterium]|nr:ABC transporter substrate-binding protein [Acetobacteraceae bacterium]